MDKILVLFTAFLANVFWFGFFFSAKTWKNTILFGIYTVSRLKLTIFVAFRYPNNVVHGVGETNAIRILSIVLLVWNYCSRFYRAMNWCRNDNENFDLFRMLFRSYFKYFNLPHWVFLALLYFCLSNSILCEFKNSFAIMQFTFSMYFN